MERTTIRTRAVNGRGESPSAGWPAGLVPASVLGADRLARGTAGLVETVFPAGAIGDSYLPGTGAGSEVLPVVPALVSLFPEGGLRRGRVLSVLDSPTLTLALLAETSAAGSWCAEIGAPLLGSVAAAEAGVVLDRFVRVPAPGERWAEAAAALIDGFDVVVVHPTSAQPGARGEFGVARDVRRLTARARERGAVVLATGPWEGAALRLTIATRRWYGVGAGTGHLTGCLAQVRVVGRGAAARPRTVTVWLPGHDGRVRAMTVEPAGPLTAPVPVTAARGDLLDRTGLVEPLPVVAVAG